MDTCEIEYTLVPDTKEKSDLWKRFNLHKRKTYGQTDADVAICKQSNSVVKLARGMSMHMKRQHPLLLLGSPVGNKGQPTRLSASVDKIPIWA